MNTIAIDVKNIRKESFGFSKSFNLLGAITGFVGGVLLMISGLILSVIKYFNKENFHGWEVIILAASFPLLVIGAHCLDLIDKGKKSKK